MGNYKHKDHDHTLEHGWVWVHGDDSRSDCEGAFCDDLSWVQLGDRFPAGDSSSFAAEDQDRTPEYGVARSNDDDQVTPHEHPHTGGPNGDGEVEFRPRAHRHPDQLPEAWCREAESETPEPEEPLNTRPNPLTKARSAMKIFGPFHSAAGPNSQQRSIFKPEHLSEIVCDLELGHDPMKGEVVYRKKVLKAESVDGTKLCKMLERKCVHEVFRDGEPLSKEMVKLIINVPELYKEGLEVVATVDEWSDWMPLKGYRADWTSYDWYQGMLQKEALNA